MAFNTIMKDLQHIFMEGGYLSKRVVVNGIRIVGLGILVGVSFLGYRWYRVSRAQAAQKRLSEVIEQYTQKVAAVNKQAGDLNNNAEALQGNSQEWPIIANLFGDAAKEYADTTLAPFFLAYQAEVLLKEGNLAEAYQIMDQVLSQLPR